MYFGLSLYHLLNSLSPLLIHFANSLTQIRPDKMLHRIRSQTAIKKHSKLRNRSRVKTGLTNNYYKYNIGVMK